MAVRIIAFAALMMAAFCWNSLSSRPAVAGQRDDRGGQLGSLPTTTTANPVRCGAPTPSTSVACYVDPAIDPNALCNDGTQPMFWYRAGYGSGANIWVIWAQGGGQCESTAGCAARIMKPQEATLLTSNGFKAGPGQGLISAESSISPLLYNANTFYLHYCSSDSWTGEKRGKGAYDENNSDTWNFEGRPIMVAEIKSIAELVPAFSSASEIVFGGDSSGAVGATLTFNDVKSLFPTSAKLRLINDAGFTLDIGQYDATIPAPYVFQGHPNSFESDVEQRFAYWNARGDALCSKMYPQGYQRRQIDCYNTSYVMQNGFIRVPAFIAISQIDTAQVTQGLCPQNFGNCQAPTDPATTAGQYTTEFGTLMASLVSGGSAAVGPNTRYVAFAPDQYLHVILNDTTIFQEAFPFPKADLTPEQVFNAWFANPKPSPFSYIGTGPGVE